MSAQGPVTDDRWPILVDCPSPWHNTARAGRGAAGKRKHERCVCPRAVQLLNEYRARQQELYLGRRGKSSPGSPPRVGRHLAIVAGGPGLLDARPDLSRSACETDEGRIIVDKLMAPGNTKHAILVAARGMCQACPVRRDCLNWALKTERPAGSWGGIYGGLLAGQRRTLAETVAALNAEEHNEQRKRLSPI